MPAAEKKTSDPKAFRKHRQRLLRRRGGGGKSGAGTS
jgi:hypothetical protein